MFYDIELIKATVTPNLPGLLTWSGQYLQENQIEKEIYTLMLRI